MLRSIKIFQSFAHRNRTFNFESGLTSIYGLNGTGKTEILELLQFGFFGIQALRGKAGNYKNHHFLIEWDIKGKKYVVMRKGTTGAELSEEGVTTVRGTKPVNARIREVFGYGLDVFQMSNAINQGKIEELGNLTPMQRKAMVDKTVGLAMIDAITDDLTKELSPLKSEYETLETVTVCPNDPGDDPDPRPLPELRAAFNALSLQIGRKGALRVRATVPYKWDKYMSQHEATKSLDDLKGLQARRLEAIAQATPILKERNKYRSEPSKLSQELHPRDGEYEALLALNGQILDLHTQLANVNRRLHGKRVPHYTKEALAAMVEEHELYDRFQRKRQLLSALGEELVCPNCDHHWHQDGSTSKALQEYDDVPEHMAPPKLTRRGIEEDYAVHDYQEQLEADKAEYERLSGLLQQAQDPGAIISAIRSQRAVVTQAGMERESHSKWLELDADLQALSKDLPDDQTLKIAEIEQWNLNHERYKEEVADKLQALADLDSIDPLIEEKYNEAMTAHTNKVVWTERKSQYTKDEAIYLQRMDRMHKVHTDIMDIENAREAVKEMRHKVKTYLIPSLNAVATALIQGMSGHWLKNVTVDPEFNVFIDGKELNELSGAGKVFGNLSTRVGLGLVLTNAVFPALFLDEIDASVDVEKAPLLMQALKELTKQIPQIIYISHKPNMAADHRVEL